MKIKLLALLNILLLLSLAACNTGTPTPTEEEVLTIINLQTTYALTHWLPKVADCANRIPEIGVYTEVLPGSKLNPDTADLVLRLGERLEMDTFVTVLGTEEIVVVAGSEVPVSSLSIESVQRIYTGEINNWGAVPEVTEANIQTNQPIQTLSFPEGHELRLLFSQTYLDPAAITSDPLVYSTVDYLETLLLNNPTAIGYLLANQVPDSVPTLSITGIDPLATQHFVLAITPQKPEGGLRQLLLCLQDSR